jgi:hypothetical protein
MQTSDTRFSFDPNLYRDWIEAKGDPEDYRRFGGLSERDAAVEIDGLFADAREAGAVTAPAKTPALEVDARASRASVLILVSDKASDHPSVVSHPIEVREVVDRDGGGADEAIEIVRFLVDHANALLEEASACLLRGSEAPDQA